MPAIIMLRDVAATIITRHAPRAAKMAINAPLWFADVAAALVCLRSASLCHASRARRSTRYFMPLTLLPRACHFDCRCYVDMIRMRYMAEYWHVVTPFRRHAFSSRRFRYRCSYFLHATVTIFRCHSALLSSRLPPPRRHRRYRDH